MNFQLQPHQLTAQRKLPFECVTLLLQGGGALGAYQGGVYEATAITPAIIGFLVSLHNPDLPIVGIVLGVALIANACRSSR